MQQQIIERAQKYKNQFEGVTRVHDIEQLKNLIIEFKCIDSYIIKKEKTGTTNEHIHFLVESDSSNLNKYRFRKWLKRDLASDIKILNGMLTLSKVRDWIQFVTYIQKEGQPDYVHNYPTVILKNLAKKSFEKKISMTKAINELKKPLYNGDIDAVEYTKAYRKLRIKYKKPDPNWQFEFLRAREIEKTDDQIDQEVDEFSIQH